MLSEAGQFYGVLVPKIIYPKLINIAVDAFNEIDERCSKENIENYLGSITNTDELSFIVNGTQLIYCYNNYIKQEGIDLFFEASQEFYKKLLDLIPSLTCDIVYGSLKQSKYNFIRRNGVIKYAFL